jgi:hypothetical protein
VNAEASPERQPTPPVTPTEASPTSATAAHIGTPSTATVNGDLSPPLPATTQLKCPEEKVASGGNDYNATEAGPLEIPHGPVVEATAAPASEAKTNVTKNKSKRKKNKRKQNIGQNGARDKA